VKLVQQIGRVTILTVVVHVVAVTAWASPQTEQGGKKKGEGDPRPTVEEVRMRKTSAYLHLLRIVLCPS